MARIQLENVGLTFHLRRQGRFSFKEILVGGMARRMRQPRVTVEALRDVNLEINEGERVGIIGHNGAGKSTLLKLLAGVYSPSTGQRRVEGRISSLFDISLGFEMHATGRENIAYRGYLQGETPRTLRSKLAPIAEFSELGSHLDMPVRYYSSGMLVRLAFSIATSIDPEILIVDEVLSAGDLAFQIKARGRMREMIAKARLVVVVSHDLGSLSGLCDWLVWLDHGQVRQIGPCAEVIDAYTRHSQGSASGAAAQAA